MSFSNPDEDREALFAEPMYVDEALKRERLVPPLLLSLPMIAAFVWLWWSDGSMTRWAVSGPQLAAGNYETILLHMFAHGGLAHIAFNIMALLAIGPAVMERLGPLGARSISGFLLLFLGCGLAGMALWLVINPASEIPMLGASGAIFGLLGAILRQPDPQLPPAPLLSKAMGKAVVAFVRLHIPLLIIFAIPLLFGSGFFGLAWEAHLGGFVAGLLLAGPITAWCGNRADWYPIRDVEDGTEDGAPG